MNDFKPSELPEDTVIEDLDDGGYWMKEESGVWGELTPHCIDCSRTVTDEGRDVVNYIDNISDKSDDFFKDFRIVSLPMSVVSRLVEEIALDAKEDWDEDLDRTKILKDVIEKVTTPLTPEEESARQSAAISKISAEYKEDLEWRHLSSFERWYAEMNERGQVRTDWDGKIYPPVFDEDTDTWLVSFFDPNDNTSVDLDVRYFVKQLFDKNYI